MELFAEPTPNESERSLLAERTGLHKKWSMALQLSKKHMERFYKRADKCIDEYMIQKRIGSDVQDYQGSCFAIFYSNVQTLAPALYSRTPEPECERVHKDRNPVARLAARIAEKGTQSQITDCKFDSVMQRCVFDYLVPSLSFARVRYVPRFEKENVRRDLAVDELIQDPNTGQVILPLELIERGVQQDEEGNYFYFEEEDRLVFESAEVEHVHFKDVLFEPARSWADVNWIAFINYLSREEATDRFGKDVADKLTYTHMGATAKEMTEQGDMPPSLFGKAKIYEIWDKKNKEVIWLCTDYEQILERREDPLKLKNFFPCPEPMRGPHSTDDFVPAPWLTFYQDLTAELNDLTERIDKITSSIRVSGWYDAEYQSMGLANAFKSDALIPIENFNAFMDRGGSRGVVQYVPMQELVGVLRELVQQRELIKQTIYEVTGMSDIIRGNTDPRETATAQQRKSEFLSLRLGDRQREVQRFARDLIEMIGEIVCEHFEPDTIATIVDFEQFSEQDQQLFPQALELLKQDSLRRFRIEIATDSTTATDGAAEKAAAVEFIQALTQFLGMSQQLGQTPALIPLLGEVLLYGVRQFKAGRSLESTIEETIERITQASQQPPQPPQPDPEQQLKIQERQLEMQLKQQEHQLEMQKLQVEIEKIRADIEATKVKAEAEVSKDISQAMANGGPML